MAPQHEVATIALVAYAIAAPAAAISTPVLVVSAVNVKP